MIRPPFDAVMPAWPRQSMPDPARPCRAARDLVTSDHTAPSICLAQRSKIAMSNK